MFIVFGARAFSPEITVHLLMRQLKIGVLSVLVMTDKLEFVGQLVSRRRTEFRAREMGDIPIASGGAASAAKPLVNEKNNQSPDVRSGRQPVTVSCLGGASAETEGRKPGDGKAWYQYIASLSVTPTFVGVPVS
ncbi:MAG: hypothetical protein IJE88_05130, partial [Akkermansia sp.]|nr:hypothetical protein [Akkermansia sp.]